MGDTSALTVDLSVDTGALRQGAAGFLYGLGNAGIPDVDTLTPIRPRVVAQKPPLGLQHPNGDCLDVAGTFIAAGGREIQVYMQDIYAKWPYEFEHIGEYLGKIETIVKAVVADPRRKVFAYVPFNEPDWIWYDIKDKKPAFFKDWETVFRKIRSLDAEGRIVGPNLMIYDEVFYEDFLKFCIANQCMPDIISWHELDSKFYGEWDRHYDSYKKMEKALGLPEMPISINEYATWRDLSVPGQLIQWISRFERSKGDGCIAYWHAAGNLDDLVVGNNQVTGAWWLFKWYADLTGHTVAVTPPDPLAEGMQAIAALDKDKRQLRIVFGGASGSHNLLIKGCASLPFPADKLRVAVWQSEWSGYEGASEAPRLVMEGDCRADRKGELIIPMKGMDLESAYSVIVAPLANPEARSAMAPSGALASAGMPAPWRESFLASEAETTDCTVSAAGNGMPKDDRKNHHAGGKWVGGMDKDTSRAKFSVEAPESGEYCLDIFYANGHDRMAGPRKKSNTTPTSHGASPTSRPSSSP